jgi:ribosomal-protein-alanine N-acetyltransferase
VSWLAALPAGAAVPLAALHAACFPEDPWDAEALGRILGLAGGFGYLAWVQGEPVGFVLARDLGDEIEILSLGVAPQQRRRGLGRRLLAAVFAAGARRGRSSIVLEVADNNAPARQLYAGFGFVPVGRRPHYYWVAGTGVDALILRAGIAGPPPVA